MINRPYQEELISELMVLLIRNEHEAPANRRPPQEEENVDNRRRIYSPPMEGKQVIRRGQDERPAHSSLLQPIADSKTNERTTQLIEVQVKVYPAKYDPIGHAKLIEAKRSRKDAVTCYRCQEKEHYAYACTKRKERKNCQKLTLQE